MPLAATADRLKRFDYASQRNGARHLFVMGEPQAGWRHCDDAMTRA
jgi:hypothetical protein